MAEALDRLQEDRANWEAWQLFRRVVTRFAMDTHTVATTFARLTQELDPDAYADLVDRFALIYDTLYPVQAQEATE